MIFFNRTQITAVLLFLFSLMFFVYAEDIKEYGEVSPEYLNMTVYPEDTSAAAIRIFDIGLIDLRYESRLEVVFTRHFQTKILKEKGKEHANVAISYWHKDHVTELDAQIIYPDGRKIKVEKDNIFDEAEKGRYKVKKLTFPNVEIGAVLEVKYEITGKDIYELEPWYFHQSIPVIESEMIAQITPGFIYMVKKENDSNRLIVESKDKYYNRFSQKWDERYRYKAENLPAIKNEPYISSLKNYKANINFQIESVQFPGYYQVFIKDLQTLCNRLLEEQYDDFKKPGSKVKELVESLVTSDMNTEQKSKVLFEYVRDNFDYKSGSGIYPQKDQEDILEEKKANDTEKNLMLMVMLRAADIEAKPLLISTTDHGLANPEIPFLSQYNRVILLVNVGNNHYLFDARDPWITYGQLPPTSLVKNALLVEKDNASFLDIPNVGLRSISIIESNLILSGSGKLQGSSQILAIGYGSRDYNSDLYEHKKMDKLVQEELAAHLDNFTVTESDSNLKAAPSDTFRTAFSFELGDYAELIDDEIYLKPGFYLGRNKNIFISEKRVFPVEFGYKRKTIETNYYTLPAGYAVTEFPEEVIIENKYFRYQRTIIPVQQNPMIVGFARQFEIKELVAPAEDYSIVKNDYAKIVDADQEIIIIKKGK
ncbi:MAG: DUF3857 and transglutaminase domain-containing protein [Calditrichaceae bacterium]|nr:DUF3857 and transglutaminase domain-containing protein [Calditrichaceae bacterium]MBN2709520.1 DUF3857 and transglutaminase domain-containing protein [Calditrichaceae bacterium]RQV93128.1 MAG: DUF3857 domain-containing protein [Calditrichota bacterium]